MESLCIPSSTSLDDRTELVHGELYREMKKKKIVFWRNLRFLQPPVLKFDQDVFDERLALAGKSRKERGN